MIKTTNTNGFTVDVSQYIDLATDINYAADICHGLAKAGGWWDKPRENGTRLMLMVSELAEAMEGDRKGINDDHLPHRKMVEVELADAIIRILDFAGGNDLDVGGAMAEKLVYNQERADHKPENRAKAGGKSY